MICNNCYKSIADDSLFCSYCGARVAKSAPVDNSFHSEMKAVADEVDGTSPDAYFLSYLRSAAQEDTNDILNSIRSYVQYGNYKKVNGKRIVEGSKSLGTNWYNSWYTKRMLYLHYQNHNYAKYVFPFRSDGTDSFTIKLAIQNDDVFKKAVLSPIFTPYFRFLTEECAKNGIQIMYSGIVLCEMIDGKETNTRIVQSGKSHCGKQTKIKGVSIKYSYTIEA